MTMPFYSSVDQLLRDQSELARKGIARGRSVVVLTFAGGVLFVAENHSPSLRKVSEIYDRIGFAAVGRYNEFETLRTQRGAPRGRPRLLLRPARRHRPVAGQRVRPVPRAHRSSSSRSRSRSSCASPRSARSRRATSSSASPTTGRSPTSRSSSSWAGRPTRSAPACAAPTRTGARWPTRWRVAVRPCSRRPRPARQAAATARPRRGCSGWARWRSRCWTGRGCRGGRSAASSARRCAGCCRRRTAAPRTRTRRSAATTPRRPASGAERS